MRSERTIEPEGTYCKRVRRVEARLQRLVVMSGTLYTRYSRMFTIYETQCTIPKWPSQGTLSMWLSPQIPSIEGSTALLTSACVSLLIDVLKCPESG
jgi:hypothetical protein